MGSEWFVPAAPAWFLAHLSLWHVLNLAGPGKHGFIRRSSVEGLSDTPDPVWALIWLPPSGSPELEEHSVT